jgi:hypothetical protein
MEKPTALIQAIDDLREEGGDTSVVTIKGSYANVYLTAGSEPIRLTREETELLLNTPDTVDILHDTLGAPVDASIELHQITVDDDVQEALERTFRAVDEV